VSLSVSPVPGRDFRQPDPSRARALAAVYTLLVGMGRRAGQQQAKTVEGDSLGGDVAVRCASEESRGETKP
jgi:hypothetical protein